MVIEVFVAADAARGLTLSSMYARNSFGGG
ncbi:hypothetical protein A9HBioS_0107 [Pseudomonas koreensis]|uniref:Uncharacterized protein n=1 Tax=Pseudomonas koreensis TaxID=198620 RepID=A0AA94ESZ0_9PSED|nr:hypothetical protein A9HBioS_0107 [Pseudomonas koreensis]